MKRIEMDTLCYLCYLQRNSDIAHTLGDEETATAFLRDVMKLYVDAPAGVSSPWFGPEVGKLIEKYYGITEEARFREEKRLSNQFVMERMDTFRQAVQAADDPVYAGLQWAVLGNYLDFSALRGEVSFEKMEQMLAQANSMELDRQVYSQLCRELETGKNLLYICDNAGEIGMDRLFAEAIAQRYPHLSITFCVRGGPAVNDATRADAEAVGIPFPVIDNGSCIAGTVIDRLGDEAKAALAQADVIISKGQANVETLLGCGYNIYYAFLVKCQRFINLFNKPKLTPMLLRERSGDCFREG